MKLRIWSWVCGGLIVVAVLILLVVVYREWFATEPCGMESRSTTLRNLFLVVGGLIAIVIATWRNLISHHGLLNERFQRGSEMLGSPVLSVRLGGIYALQRLAEDELKQYHVQVMRLLCAFVRNPTKDEDDKTKPPGTEKEPNIKDYKVREDVQEAMTAIGARSDAAVELEKKADPPFLPDLSGAYLPFVRLFKANLTDADLTDAKFFPANLTVQDQEKSKKLKLSSAGADLAGTNFSNAFLTVADLTRVHLSGTNLTGTQLAGVKSLTQRQLDQACANPENPPNLSNLRDPATDLPLEWRGKPCRK